MFSSLRQNKNDDASRSTIYKNDAESRIWYLGDPPGIDSPGEPFRQVRVEPVSYTHLDVYKRQGRGEADRLFQ